MSNREQESKVDMANKYLEIAKTCQDQLWKRRQVEWKNGFALWTAIAVATGFILQSIGSIFLPDHVKWSVPLILSFVYVAIVIVHRTHLKAIFISNEKDLEFLNYYRDRAAWELCNDDFEKKPKRPLFKNMSDREYYNKHREKMKHHYTPIAITTLIAMISWTLILLMCHST